MIKFASRSICNGAASAHEGLRRCFRGRLTLLTAIFVTQNQRMQTTETGTRRGLFDAKFPGMDREQLTEHLAQAERHVEQSYEHVARQRELVTRLRRYVGDKLRLRSARPSDAGYSSSLDCPALAARFFLEGCRLSALKR